MGAPKTTGKRSSYGAEIDGLLKDYCAAVHGAAERNVVRDAIKHFIAHQLRENQGIRQKFEDIRKKRIASERPDIQAVESTTKE